MTRAEIEAIADPIERTRAYLDALDALIAQHDWRKSRGRKVNPPTKPPVVTTSAPPRPMGIVLELQRREVNS